MASQLSPLGQFSKWLVLPAVLACTGFFLIGPRLQKTVPNLEKPAANSSSKPASTESSPSATDGTESRRVLRRSAPSTRDMTNAPATQTQPDQGGPDVTIRERPANGGDPSVVYQTPRSERRSETRKRAPRRKVHVKTEVKVDSTDSGSVGGLDNPGPQSGSKDDSNSGSNPGP